jgi:cytochrome c-type biogenesis protein CcmE
MTRKQQRLGLVALGMAALAGATALVLTAFSANIVFFFNPSDLKTQAISPDRRVRIGGLVEDRSVQRGADSRIAFRITDGKTDIAVLYHGILPDLFREGQGVVAEGALDSKGVFRADTVLAKHDETYMPKDVADALKKQGHWKDDYGAKPVSGVAAGQTSQAAQNLPAPAPDPAQGVRQ